MILVLVVRASYLCPSVAAERLLRNVLVRLVFITPLKMPGRHEMLETATHSSC